MLYLSQLTGKPYIADIAPSASTNLPTAYIGRLYLNKTTGLTYRLLDPTTDANKWEIIGDGQVKVSATDEPNYLGAKFNTDDFDTTGNIISLKSGGGSGLDADTIDGLDSTQFLRSDIDDEFTGTTLSINSGANAANVIDLTQNNARFWANKNAGNSSTRYLNVDVADDGTSAEIAWKDNTDTPLQAILITDSNITINGGTVWHANNDGAGSGLDADSVDGLQADQFVRSDTDDTMNGSYTVTGNFTISQNATINGDATVQGNAVINGDLTVNGTTTTIETTELVIEDNTITLNSGETGAGVTEGTAGIEVDRGTLSPAKLLWDETDDKWKIDVGNGILKPLNSGALDAEALIYYLLLDDSPFKLLTFDVFHDPAPELTTIPSGSYDPVGDYVVLNNGESFTTTNVNTDGNPYQVYQVHVECKNDDGTNYTVEYSVDGGSTWITLTDPYRVELDTATSDFRLRVTSNLDGLQFDSWGVLYNETGYEVSPGVTNILETYVADGTESAGDLIKIPNDKVYLNNGKSLKVYLNGVLQQLGDFYTEEDSTHIRLNAGLTAGDVITFIEYYGYVFLDNETKNLLTLSLNYRDVNSDYTAIDGDYIFADTSAGSFTITLTPNPSNGTTIYINDVKGTFATNNVVLTTSDGKTIMGNASLNLDVSNREYKAIYNAQNGDWRVV